MILFFSINCILVRLEFLIIIFVTFKGLQVFIFPLKIFSRWIHLLESNFSSFFFWNLKNAVIFQLSLKKVKISVLQNNIAVFSKIKRKFQFLQKMFWS